MDCRGYSRGPDGVSPSDQEWSITSLYAGVLSDEKADDLEIGVDQKGDETVREDGMSKTKKRKPKY